MSRKDQVVSEGPKAQVANLFPGSWLLRGTQSVKSEPSYLRRFHMNKIVLYFRRVSHMRRCAITTTLLSMLVLLPAAVVAQTHFELLHTFKGSDGAMVAPGLILDAAGNVYGAATVGGDLKCFPASTWQWGCGTVFELSKTGEETVLHRFKGPSDGAFPLTDVFFGSGGTLSRDSEGNLYGTTGAGGNTNGYCLDTTLGCGIVFEIDKTGKETVLYRFSGTKSPYDGDNPGGGVIPDGKGNLYGTTYLYGSLTNGTIFKIDIKTRKETILYNFEGTNSGDGAQPVGNLVEDGAGTFYGVTWNGGLAIGDCGNNGCGTIFKFDKSGETVLYKFTGTSDGANPSALTLDGDGNFYGAAFNEGAGCGVVYELSKTGAFTVLHTFNGKDGCNPEGQVVFDGAGNLYGGTFSGGSLNSGTVFKLTKASRWRETVLHNFSAGGKPRGGLTIDATGSLYGTTVGGGDQTCKTEDGTGCGTVFKITQ